ncbi:SdrD B-like domain-containing protein, partial [Limnofasciculus baicalensis]
MDDLFGLFETDNSLSLTDEDLTVNTTQADDPSTSSDSPDTESSTSEILTVSTDKPDYKPGSTAIFTVNGVGVGETVKFYTVETVAGDDGVFNTYQPFVVTDGGAGDSDGLANGQIVTSWLVPPDPDGTGPLVAPALNATLKLTATAAGGDGAFGTADDRVATTTFTDGPNPPPVQLFYVPQPENQLLLALQTIEAGGPGITPTNPVQTYISIAAVANGTIIYYDQAEDGYEADIANPTQSTTQIWGDGNLLNGVAPGTGGTDLINAGTVIVLNNAIDTSLPPTTPYPYSGGDKIAATKTVAITRSGWAAGPNSLLAGGLEVFDTDNWGTDYRVPVGVNIPDTTDFQMFEYTGLAIMAGELGAVISVDANADGDFIDAGDVNNLSLTQGQSYLVNGGVNVGARVVSDKAVQVDLITGDIGSNYESRDSALLPTNIWSDSYYTPVSTASSVTDVGGQGTFNGTDTTVWLYNPGTTAINVTFARRIAGVVNTSTISVPGGTSGGYAKQLIPDGSGAHFFTQGNEKFYAFSTTDSNSGNTNGTGNQNWDWGYTLVPEDSLTTQVLIGLGIGRDPTSATSPTQNGNPVWVTPIGNGETLATIYVDYNGDNLGAFTDPNGNKYDTTLSLKELERAKVYDPDGNQTGMLLYTLDPGVKLAAAWGQDPSAASAGAPGLDVGAGIPPLPEFDAGKNGTLLVDADGDGFVSPGDTLIYTISIPNISRAPVPNIKLLDNLPVDTTYVANSTKIDRGDGLGFVSFADAGTTAFPLDEGGAILGTIPVKKTFTVTFEAKIDAFNDLVPGTTTILNTGEVSALGEKKPIQDITPLYGKIGDFVWKDLDGDGVQDGGAETGISGVTLNLYKDANGNSIIDGGDTIVATQTTNASGGYLFTGLLGGNYIVDVVNATVPADSVLTTANDPKPLTLAAGQSFLTADFGYQPLGNITGNVKADNNNDDIGDTGISGVTLTLYTDPNGDGNASDGVAITSTTTDASGNYTFNNVSPGSYVVVETQPSGYLTVSDGDSTTSGDDAANSSITDNAIPVAVTAGETDTGNDFVEELPGTISGNVKEDIDNNDSGD